MWAPLRAFRARVGALYDQYVRLAMRRPRLVGLGIAIACLPAAVLDVQFFSRVRAGLQDLLPADSPTVRALETIHARLGGKSHLAILASSADAAQNRALIRSLGERLAARGLPTVRSLQWNVTQERDWLLDRGALLMDRGDFDALAATLEDEIHAQKAAANPLVFDLEPSSPPEPSGEALARDQARRAAQQALVARASAADRFPTGFLEEPGGTTVLMLIWLNGSELELEPANRLVAAVDAEVAPLRRQFPGVRVVYNGEVQNLIEEHAAILADLSLSSVLVFVLVGTLIVLYFRSLRAVAAVALALLPGLCLTFAIGRLTVGSLNSNTAFLGSIIAGNGINYPLLLLAYYRAVPRTLERSAAFASAARRALPGTLGAAATASAAYAGLAAAEFRGFSEFGWIGGLGMLTTWAATFATLPAAVGWLDPPRQRWAGNGDRAAPAGGVERFYDHRWAPRLAAALFVASAVGLSALGALAAQRRGVFETSISALRNRDSIARGSASWDATKNRILGVWLNPVVALTGRPEDREPSAAALRRTLMSDQPPLAERVETLATYVPPQGEQERRLAVLRRAARLRESFWSQLSPAAQTYFGRWLSPENLRAIRPEEVPDDLVSAFREVDGRSDRVVLVYPSLAVDYDDSHNVLRFADRLQAAGLPSETATGGAFLFMAVLLRLLQREAPEVVLWVCLLVALALVPVFAARPQRIPICVAAIAAAAVCAQAIMLACGVRLNLLNFAAVPITIGVGSDYVVNLFGAMDAYAVDARRAAARMGGAILLCSLTTVVGYLSLVFAQSGALRTFGWAAVLGEVMAVLTVLLVLPALARPRPPRATCPEAFAQPPLRSPS